MPTITASGVFSLSSTSIANESIGIEDSIVRTVELQRSIGGRGACATSMARRAVRRVFYDRRRAVVELRSAGTPQTRDGKPDLAAPAPRTADGKPDLSGTWMHEVTTVAEMKRLYGALVDEAIKVDVPGMEIGTQHKYAVNLLLDFKPDDVSMRPAGAAVFKQRAATADPAEVCTTVAGFPLAGLLSEPIRSFRRRRRRSSYTKRTICIVRSSAMVARSRKSSSSRRSSATRSGGGRGTSSWSRPKASTTRHRSI